MDLQEYIDSISSGIIQRTENWNIAKKWLQGGSTMGIIEGTNPYKSLSCFIREKIHNPTPRQNIILDSYDIAVEDEEDNKYINEKICSEPIKKDEYTVTEAINVLEYELVHRNVAALPAVPAYIPGDRFQKYLDVYADKYYSSMKNYFKMDWGTIMEEVITRCVEYYKKCKVMGDNIFVYGPPGTAYSPDGLAEIDGEIKLLEFKCPYNRIPNGKIPGYYKSQVLMGLNIIPACQRGLYIEGVYRICPLSKYDWSPNYSTWYAGETFSKVCPGGKVMARGIVGFYEIDKNHRQLSAEIGVDIGTKTEVEASMVFAGACDKLFGVWYSDIEYAGVATTTSAISAYKDFLCTNNFKSVGFAPWKLFDIRYIDVDKQPGYLEKYLPCIRAINTTIKECLDPDNAEYVNSIIEAFENKYCRK